MSNQATGPRDQRLWKRWFVVVGAFIPIWAVLFLAGWIVIATLLPITIDETMIAKESPENEILDFMPASGPSAGVENP